MDSSPASPPTAPRARGSVLLVDDDADFARDMARGLAAEGHEVRTASTLAEAAAAMDERPPDVVFLDLLLPDGNGLQLLRDVRPKRPATTFVILSGYGTVGTAVEAIRDGAVDFVEKPVRLAHVAALVQRALEGKALQRKVAQLREDVEKLQGTRGMLGESPAVRRTLETIDALSAAPDTTVLITGESGTGKELAARAIHDASPRVAGPFVAVNCAALTETLLESELFGYEAGAFTGGQKKGKEGLFEAADGGTLFLDEISELAPNLQAKLLRALQERTVRRVGGVKDRAIDIRVIASTNRNLAHEVKDGRFRSDLYYRLRVATVALPPLRDRGDDVVLIAEHYVRHFARQMGRHVTGFSPAALAALRAHRWPGNVRELRNVVEYAVILCPGGLVEPEHLNLPTVARAALDDTGEIFASLPDRRLETMERELIRRVLEAHGGHVAPAARELGINRQTLYNKIKAYGL